MSFIVVNTGRAASRAFYLNLKRQAGVVTLSRKELDRAVRESLGRRRPDALRELMDAYRRARSLREGAVAGLVYHGVRPSLRKPYDHPDNAELLGLLRDELGVRTAFLVVREPRAMALSELNRVLAKQVGDWTFEPSPGSWASTFTFEDLAALARSAPAPPGPIEDAPRFDADRLRAMLVEATRTKSRIFSMFELFERVFPEVRYVDYGDFVERPVETFRRMGAVGGFAFEDLSLVHTKLNGLANRLLVYNPVRVACPGPPKRGLFDRKTTPVQYRFELTDVLPSCDDWRHHEAVTADCSRHLEAVEADLGSRLSLGVCTEDVERHPRAVGEVLRGEAFVRTLLDAVGPLFADNYRRSKEFFKQRLYLRALPDEVYDAFWEENGAQYEALWAARDQGRLVPV